MQALSLAPIRIDFNFPRHIDPTIEFHLMQADGTDVDITSDEVSFRLFDGETADALSRVFLVNHVGDHSSPATGKTQFKMNVEWLNLTGKNQSGKKFFYEVRRYSTTNELVYFQGFFSIT